MPGKPRNFLEDGFDLPKLEEKILKFWDERNIFEKSIAGTAKGKPFVFYEGPPYANGKPGIHHVLARVVKDVMLRYKTMRGYHVPRRAGWDTHGLPVEMAAEKALGFKSKRDIEKFGVKEFNEEARKQVWIYKDEWERLTKRIGYWLDLKNAYVTYAPEYIETIWWTLSEMWKKKLLYKGHKVVQWCTRCGTALSSHELAQGYQEVVDNSVFIKFKLKKGQRIGNFIADDATYILSWTTTPWTLPGNVALAVGEDINYVFVRTTAPDRASYIVAKDLAAQVLKDSDFAVLGEVPGRRLLGLEYEPLFHVSALQKPLSYKVYGASFVTTGDGTGIVHTAVMYGEDDYALGKKVGLPEHHTVDEEGKFTKDVPALMGEYVKAKSTEEKIFGHLRRAGNLFRIEAYKHEYPHCWRCGTPVLYYARDSWFIAMSKLRKELLARNNKINWMPAHVKKGRFGEWLREAKDWNLSRERYWGAPLPIWECHTCNHTEVIGGLDELSSFAGGAKNRYWAMRHGEAENNVRKIIDSGSGTHFHLTEKGEKTAKKSLEKLKATLWKNHKAIDLIFSSDVTRTQETAAIAADVLGVKKIILEKRLREIKLGPYFDGHPVEEYWKAYPTHADRFSGRPEGGESRRDVRKRVWDFLKECEGKYSDKDILIVSHGDPLLVLYQAAAGISEKQAIDSVEEIYTETGQVRAVPLRVVPRDETGEVDLHRPFADAITAPCKKCGGEMRRVPEVADVWYDSGAMPLAQAHFPFDEKRSALKKPAAYPADYIAEGIDQTRGWFYTMLAIATALGYEAPYRNVITFGLINDKFGKKMSKSKGNIVEPFAVIDKFGVDAVRWYFYAGTPFGEPKNFDEEEIARAFRKTHLIIYNSFIFWKTYALQKNIRPRRGNAFAAPKSKHVLDHWIISRVNELMDAVTKKLDRYEIREAAIEMEAFVDDLSRWYIRRSRRRLQRPANRKDYQSASATLGHVLFVLTTAMAPFTPFFSEVFYAALGGTQESVHLERWPGADRKQIKKKLNVDMATIRSLAAAGLAKRAEAGIKVRQPLASLSIGSRLSKELAEILAEEVNVKKILVNAKLKNGVELDTLVTRVLREEGLLRDVTRIVQELRQKANLAPKDKIALFVSGNAVIQGVVQAQEVLLRTETGAKTVEYKRSEKFSAESETKIEGEVLWVGLRKI